MIITLADVEFSTSYIEDTREGFAGLELRRKTADNEECAARVLFWDASGQFFVETFNGDVPLVVLEEVIEEARQRVITR